tara:strand:- start:500 stop:1150 length:651 start_codon:yes stop_codon:yes gene_type:complete
MEGIINLKTIGKRKNALSKFLKGNTVGYELNNEELILFKDIFSTYYTPSHEYEEKFSIDEIDKVYIGKNMNNHQFRIVSGDIDTACGIKWLAGSKRSNKCIISNCLRHEIKCDIIKFINMNPLNSTNICPITNKILGLDAQVDHEPPFTFKNIHEHWLKEHNYNNEDIIKECNYDREVGRYILNEPFKSQWREYHRNNAKLRWLSKEGNKKAHLDT